MRPPGDGILTDRFDAPTGVSADAAPQAGSPATNPTAPLPVVEIRGETEGGRDHINKLSLKYRGDPEYKAWGGQVENRNMYIVEPDKINASSN